MKKIKRNKKQNKIKVVAYCDSPSVATGFGTVSRNILTGLYNTGRYDIDVLGINYWGDPHEFPFRIFPTGVNSQRDPYGREKICSMILQMQFDILFYLQDTFILSFLPELIKKLEHERNNDFRSICYFPVDGRPKNQWIHNINAVHHPVAYTQFGHDQAKEVCPEYKGSDIVFHGVNTKEYFVLPEKDSLAFRSQYFGRHSEKFIITNLNRNQQRKDIPRTIQAFAEFRKDVKDSILYLHMARKDQGWDLVEVCKAHGLDISNDVIFPENFGPNQGYPREIVNMIYNASDCVVSTTLGEGMGLSWIESMATKTPTIVPDNTAMSEFVNDDNGYLVKSGTNPSLFTVIPNDNEIIRPLVDVEDLIDKFKQIYFGRDEAKRRAETAYKWVTNEMDWQKSIVPQWVKIFDKEYADLKSGKQSNLLIDGKADNIISAESF